MLHSDQLRLLLLLLDALYLDLLRPLLLDHLHECGLLGLLRAEPVLAQRHDLQVLWASLAGRAWPN